MDPSRCTIVYLQQASTIQPFSIDDDNNNESDSTHILESVFGQVSVQQNLTGTMDYIKQNNDNTLLLVDLDTIIADNNNDETTDHHFSCSTTTTCSTFTDSRIHWIQQVIRNLNNIPVVVCSTDDSSSLMLDCIHAGAADFILKPFRLDVIKTLFLKLHQSNIHIRKQVNDSLNQRIKDMTLKDTQLSNILMKIYGPQSNIAKSILKVNNESISELESSLYHWDFSPFGQSQQDLIQCAYNIFDLLLKLPELYHLSMTKDQLYGFLTDLANVYHDENPYHNFAHAVDVLQCLFFMLCEMGVLPFTSKKKKGLLLRPSDAFALLIAAIGHDAAHPGVNNLFLINSATPLAALYNDRSVLESLHSMTLFQILRNHHILDHLEKDIYKEFRKIVVSSILATDMSLHAEYVSKIRDQAIRLNRTDINTLDSATLENERVLMCSALIKCADISNVARPFRSGARWAELLVEEFVSQGDLERELGMPVLPMNDREKVVLEDSQIGFIRFVALDLFQSVNDMCEISFAVDQMQANLKKWEMRKQTTMQHDSGVSNLDDEYTNTTTGRPSLEALRTSIESDQLDELPMMPAVAKSSYSHSMEQDERHHVPVEIARDWSDNATYCQCTIQ